MSRTLAVKFQIRVPSFDQQADLIIKALSKHYDEIIIPKTNLYGQRFTTWFVFTPAMASYLFQLAMSGAMINAQRVMYVTAEGVPNINDAQRNLLGDSSIGWEVLSVSKFTDDMLRKVGIKTKGIVPHAIDEDEPFICKPQAEALRKRYQAKFPDRVLFSYTGSTVARKKAPLMIDAFRRAVKETKNKIALISNSALQPLLKPSDDWCLEENIFGRAPHSYVTALSGAVDFMLWSTVCEGFGVPPLESMNCGVPVVAGRFPPSTEFMTEKTTVWFECPVVKYENYGLEQDFEMHYYLEDDLVDAIKRAVDIFINYKDTYTNMQLESRAQASKYDYRKVYGKELRRYLA